MAIIASNQKRARTSVKSQQTNVARKSSLKTTLRNFNDAIENNDLDLAKELLPKVQKSLDEAVSHNLYHLNYANRHKSKAAKKINKLEN